MYTIVLATMLTAGGEAPSFCHNYCHFCSCSCYNCYCSGCYGCYGCSGCYSCYGCYGCYGCSCFSCYCSGCYGYSYCSGCYGCFGCYASCYCSGCYGCHGCSAIVVYPSYACSCAGGSGGSVAPSRSESTTAGLSADELGQVRDLLEKVKEMKSDSSRYEEFVSKLAERKTARLTISVPEEAELYVNNSRCPLTSEERSFETPELEKGKRYFYTLRAEVMQEGRLMQSTKKIYLTAGKHIRVDLRDNMTVVRTAQR